MAELIVLGAKYFGFSPEYFAFVLFVIMNVNIKEGVIFK